MDAAEAREVVVRMPERASVGREVFEWLAVTALDGSLAEITGWPVVVYRDEDGEPTEVVVNGQRFAADRWP